MTKIRLARAAPLAFLLAWAAYAAAPDARAVMEETVDQVLAVLRDGTLSDENKLGRIRKIAESRFDFERMSKLVLARNRRKLTPEQQAEFVVEFKRHLTVTYGRRIGEFSNEQIEVVETRPETKGDVTVKTLVTGGAAADGVKIDYRMRMRDDSWYVIDVIIEGVSLISNFRSQVQEIVSAKGADQLIQILREKNDKEAQEG
jgi:phospholipid transport system substrate-binding protein